MNKLKLYSVSDVAELLDMNEQVLRKLCREKKIAHTRLGPAGRYKFTEADINALVKRVEVEE